MKPPQVKIIIDTREQVPLVFDVPTEVRKLDTGDYSVEGYESEFTVERKTLTDLVRTVIHERERFERELERMRTYGFRRVLVVATYAQTCEAYPFSMANPRSVIASLAAFEARYGVPVVFANGPREAVARITDWAKYYVRERLKVGIKEKGRRQS